MQQISDATTNDNAIMEKFNYKQELKRTIRLFGSFAVAFSVISLTTGIFQNFGFVLTTVGPLGVLTFPIVGIGSFIVALVLSEISAIVPITGQCYTWVSKLCNPGVGWFVGWINFCYTLIIASSVNTAIGPILAILFGFAPTPYLNSIVAIAVLTIQLLLNIFSVKISTLINSTAVVTESVGVLLLTVVLAICALQNHAPVSNIVAVNSNLNGKSLFMPIMMSFLMGFYTLVAFESAANMSDETQAAAKNVPKAMLMAVGLSTLLGTLFLLASTWAIKDLSAVEKSSVPLPMIIESNLGNVVGKLFLVVVCISIFACGLVSLTNASRTIYAMSRDNVFFASKLFKKVSTKTSTPIYACIFVWVVGTAFLIFTTPTVLAVASAAMPSLYYIITLVSYLTVRKKMDFPKHYFHLGKLGVPTIIIALIWLIFGLSVLSIPAEFRGGTIVNISLSAIGIVLYLVYFKKKVYSKKIQK